MKLLSVVGNQVDKIVIVPLIGLEILEQLPDVDEVYVRGYDKDHLPEAEKQMILIELRKAMLESAEKLEFEKAAKIRDEIDEFEKDLGITVS